MQIDLVRLKDNCMYKPMFTFTCAHAHMNTCRHAYTCTNVPNLSKYKIFLTSESEDCSKAHSQPSNSRVMRISHPTMLRASHEDVT